MRILKMSICFGLLCAVVLLAGCKKKQGDAGGASAGADTGKSYLIKIAHDSKPGHPSQVALEEFEANVEAQSEGRIDVQIFPNSQMGTFSELFSQTRDGDIDMSLVNPSNVAPTITELSMFDTFYMFDDEEHAYRVLDGEGGAALLKPFEEFGLVGLGFMGLGFRNFSNGKRAINSIDDLKGLKIRGYNEIQIAAWESVGCNLTNIAWAEMFTSLQQKLIDGQECATTSFYTAKFYEAQDFWSLTKHIYSPYIWYANKAFMDGLPAEDKALIMAEVDAAIVRERELVSAQEKETLDMLPGLGIEVNEVSLETRQQMGEIMNAAVKDKIIEKCGEEVYNAVLADVEEERSYSS